MKKQSVIVINGRRYDARTGKSLHAGHPHAPKPHAPKPHTVHSSASYRPTRHIRAHRTEPPRTLMRKGVKKPVPSAKRHIKVQGSLSAGDSREPSRIISRRHHTSYGQHRRNHAVKATHSRLISHFSPELFSVDDHTSLAIYGSGAVHRTASRRTVKPAAKKPTADELFDYAVHHASPPRHHVAKRRHGLIRHRRHAKHHA